MCSGLKLFLAMLLLLSVAIVQADAADMCVADEAGRVTWTARSREEVLRCNSAGYEPRDMSSIEPGRTVAVKLERARIVRVFGAEEVQSVKWLDPADDLSLLAERDLSGSSEFYVNVARLPRVLSLSWAGGERRSVFIAPEADEVAVSKPPAGAEVLSFLGDRSVRPVRLRLESVGVSHTAEFGRSGFTSISGLPPGLYRIEAEYRGDVVVRVADRLRVRVGELLRITRNSVPPAAALLIRMEPEACDDLRQDEITAVVALSGGANEWNHDVKLSAPSCEALVEGLDPEIYVVSVGGPDGPLSDPTPSAKLQLDRMSSIDVTPRYGRIDGRLLLGRDPGRRLVLVFQRQGQSKTASSDEEGYFSLTLDPGSYEVSLRSSEFVPGDWKTIEVKRGRQTIELAFEASRLSIRARASSGTLAVPVQIRIQSEGTVRAGIALPPEHRAEFIGIPGGTYLITAAAPPDWESIGETKVTLDRLASDKEVDVFIQRATVRHVRLVNPAGAPVTGASVRLGSLVLLEAEPGLYRAASAAGSTLRVAASGYLPVCRELAESEREVGISLSRGSFSATLRLSGVSGPVGSILGLPGTNCPVLLSEIEHRLTATPDGLQAVLEGLPPGQFTYISPDGSRTPFSAPGESSKR